MLAVVQPSQSRTDESNIGRSHQGRSSTDSRLPVHLNLQQHCSCAKSGKVMIGRGFLTAEMVDVLESQQVNWIIELSSEQILDLHDSDVKHLSIEQVRLKNRRQNIVDLVAGIPLAAYQSLEVNREMRWFVMFSCWIGGWGKVRFIVSCQSPIQSKTVLVTNRLDWSPSKILKLFLQAHFS